MSSTSDASGNNASPHNELDTTRAPKAVPHPSFSAKLKSLLDVTLDLSMVETLDELCRLAVDWGKRRLGIERLSIWLRDSESTCVGTYGVDEKGAIRDERGIRRPIGHAEAAIFSSGRPEGSACQTDDRLSNHLGEQVGRGSHARCGLWDGRSMIGVLHADTLLSGKQLGPQQLEILNLYASSLGHLCALKRAETSLRQMKGNLQIAAEAARLGIWHWDARANQVSGWGQLAVSARPEGTPRTYEDFLSCVHPEDRELVCAKIAEAMKTGGDYEAEFRILVGDSIHWVLDKARVTCDSAGQPISMTGINLDITQQKLAERERERMQEQLFKSQKLESLGVVVGGISHDFSNMLTIIAGNAHLLQSAHNLSEDQIRALMDIEATARQATEMARSLQSFSKPPRPEIRRIDANRLVEDVHRLIRRLYPATITFRLHLWPEQCAIAADPGQIQQVLVNLCVNARDAMPTGGTLTIETRLVERASLPPEITAEDTEASYVLIRVADTGIGMSESTLRQAFDPFFTTKPKDLGTGLGLAVVHKIVRAHAGFIDMTSSPGEGTQVDLLFPAVTRTDPARDVADVVPTGGKESVLVVEDEEMIASLLRTALESRGYIVSVAHDPETAIRLAENPANHFDLGIIDYSMPKLTGDRCLVQMRRIQSGMRAVLITGHNLDVQQLATRELYLLKKPFSLPTLVKIVREVLDADRQPLGSLET